MLVAEGDSSHAVKLLKELTQRPLNRENEGVIWLTLGSAYEAAKKVTSAIDAYVHAQSLTTPESRTYADASAAIARLK